MTTTVPGGAAGSPTASAATPGPERTWQQRWARPAVLANLVGQVAIIVTGGAVRLTGSGLGCSTWPQCEPGSFTPVLHEATSYHPYVEFGNRLVSVLLTTIGIAVVLTVWGDRGRARSYRLLGLVPLLGVLAQAVIGGATVLLDLHPGWVGLHMIASLALVAAAMLLVHREREGDGPPVHLVPRSPWVLSRLLLVQLVLLSVLGVITTGSGPHSGDEQMGYRLAFDPMEMARAHSAAVWMFVAIVGGLLLLTRTAPARVRRAVWLLLGVTLAQGAVGYLQVATGLPIALVNLHMLGAALLVAATVHTVLAIRTRG